MSNTLLQNKNSQQFCIILTTTDSQLIADKIAKTLVENNLASCVQIDNITSIYKWNDVVTSNPEFRLIIKAQSSCYNEIQNCLVSIHNYEIPEIIKLNIDDGFTPYLNWLQCKNL